ncbi:protein NLRC3-like isoform X2 [Protopterus annectens]|nr:protein NLRC3-like isoform X2 [Protopterus annectens]
MKRKTKQSALLSEDEKNELAGCKRNGNYGTFINRTIFQTYSKTFLIPTKDQNHLLSVQSNELFTQLDKITHSMKRMLLVGEPGMGKSLMTQEVVRESNAGKLRYRNVLNLTFDQLNEVQDQTSIRKLISQKNNPFSKAILTALINTPNDVLIILDGLDEFKHDLSKEAKLEGKDISSSLPINTIVFNIITKSLLPEVSVLVTTRRADIENIAEYFDCMLILQEFSREQLESYYMSVYKKQIRELLENCFQMNPKLRYLVHIPFNNYILHQILEGSLKNSNQNNCLKMLSTCSKLLSNLIYYAWNRKTKNGNDVRIHIGRVSDSLSFSNTVYHLGKLSYHHLLSGNLNITVKDAEEHGVNKSILKIFHGLIFKKPDKHYFEYQHSTVKDVFAAMYCVIEIKNAAELMECLNAWWFGKANRNPKCKLITPEITTNKTQKLQTFMRFFMGCFYMKKDLDSDHWNPNFENDSKKALTEWFVQCTQQSDFSQNNLLNLLHCLSELENHDVTKEVACSIKKVDFFNIPLTSADISAMQFCLEHSQLDELDIRLCGLGDEGIKRLRRILLNSKCVRISSNNLTEKSATVLRWILEDPACAIEEMAASTNTLECSGAQQLWKALQTNTTLRFLYVDDNNITGDAIADLDESLKKNSTIKTIHMCCNPLGIDALRRIQDITAQCPVKIVTRIVEDEGLISYTAGHVKAAFTEWQQYNHVWLQSLLQAVLQDLTEEEPRKELQEKVIHLKEDINQLLKIIRDKYRERH